MTNEEMFEQKQLSRNLTKIASKYNKYVDSHGDDAEKEFNKHAKMPLDEQIEEALTNTKAGQKIVDDFSMNKAKTVYKYNLQSYQRYKNNDLNASTAFWNEETALPDNRYNCTKKTMYELTRTFYKTAEANKSVLSQKEKRTGARLVDDVAELKESDVIQMYVPYATPKKNAKKMVDQYGQNRYYGVIRPLPNGDVLAIQLYGHSKSVSSNAKHLEFNPEYGYPTSPNVSANLEIDTKKIIQLPKEALKKGSQLREKYEAAAYDKPFNESLNPKIKILSMSPENKTKFAEFTNDITDHGKKLNIGWSSETNQVVAATFKGKLMLNQVTQKELTSQVESGVFAQRDVLLTQRIARQDILRETKYANEINHRNVKSYHFNNNAYDKQAAKKETKEAIQR